MSFIRRIKRKGGASVTIEQLQEKLLSIPPVGAINKARRREIIALINKLTEVSA